jgi:hypothetical protein
MTNMSGVFWRRAFFAPQEFQDKTRGGGSAIAARYSFSEKLAEAAKCERGKIINRGKSG